MEANEVHLIGTISEAVKRHDEHYFWKMQALVSNIPCFTTTDIIIQAFQKKGWMDTPAASVDQVIAVTGYMTPAGVMVTNLLFKSENVS